MRNLLERYTEVFDDPTIAKVKPQRILPRDPKSPLPEPQKRRPIPAGMIEKLNEQEEKWNKMGCIEDVDIEDSEFASNLCFSAKKDANSNKIIGLRTNLDLRKINEKILSNSFPLPRQDELLSGNISRCSYFSSLDLSAFFNQIPVDEESRKFLCYYSSKGLKRFKTLPFGLKTASQIAQCLLTKRFQKYTGIFLSLFIDDICIYSETFKEHLDHVEIILSVLADMNLKAKSSKCSFGCSSVTYLGYTLSKDGLRPSARHTDGLMKYPKPQTRNELVSFIGLCEYFHEFVKQFSLQIQPLREVKEKLKKNEKVVWTPELNKTFENMKSTILKSTLILPSVNPKFELETDASDGCLGAVLRDWNHPTKPGGVCAYLRRNLKGPELLYPASEKEALGIKFAVDKCRSLLLGRHFKIKSDCKAWSWLTTKNSVKSERWRQELCEYDHEIVHVAGKDNIAADFLSRPPGMVGAAESLARTNETKTESINPEKIKMWLRLKEIHDEAHGPVTNLINKARKEFPKTKDLEKMCQTVIDQCRCVRSGPHQKTKRDGTVETGKIPYEILHIDMKGPYDAATNGPKYFLTIKCTFSNKFWAIPMPAASGDTVKKTLMQFFINHGHPRKIKFDQGTNFRDSGGLQT